MSSDASTTPPIDVEKANQDVREAISGTETDRFNAQCRCVVRLSAALTEIVELRERVGEQAADIAHAQAEAKKYSPDYPWALGTASEVARALGTSAEGRSLACDDLHKTISTLTAERDAARDEADRLGLIVGAIQPMRSSRRSATRVADYRLRPCEH